MTKPTVPSTPLLSGGLTSLSQIGQPKPTPRKAPAKVKTFLVRLELLGIDPPVWRRLELPGNITLPLLHDVIQAAMGWTDSHLHRFRTGSARLSPYFITDLDLYENEDGPMEDDVRLDQLVARAGSAIWYEYDFGDTWNHVLKVEKILNDPPTRVACTDGQMACPPEDCGGNESYEELANWVRSGGSADYPLPDSFENAAHAREWLPPGWDPDHFDIGEANAAIAGVVSW